MSWWGASTARFTTFQTRASGVVLLIGAERQRGEVHGGQIRQDDAVGFDGGLDVIAHGANAIEQRPDRDDPGVIDRREVLHRCGEAWVDRESPTRVGRDVMRRVAVDDAEAATLSQARQRRRRQQVEEPTARAIGRAEPPVHERLVRIVIGRCRIERADVGSKRLVEPHVPRLLRTHVTPEIGRAGDMPRVWVRAGRHRPVQRSKCDRPQ